MSTTTTQIEPLRRRELRARADENVRRGYGYVEFLTAGETVVLIDQLDATLGEMQARELHHFETERAMSEALTLLDQVAGDDSPMQLILDAHRILTEATA